MGLNKTVRATFVDSPAVTLEATDSQLAERALVSRCIKGERAAMAELYRQYYQRVYNLVVRMVGPQEADELAQDSFVRIFKGLSGFRGGAALGTWIYRLTMNVCLSYLSKKTRRRRLQQRYEREHAGSETTPAGKPLLKLQLEKALLELPPGYRAVLVLHDVEGLNHQEIAKVLGVREGTSKSQLHKARMRMRELLSGPELSAHARKERP
jgi:RNA polymerase sigma-70 factor (ECF subfamily)